MFYPLLDPVNRSGGVCQFSESFSGLELLPCLRKWAFISVRSYFSPFSGKWFTENFRKWVLIYAKNEKWVITISEDGNLKSGVLTIWGSKIGVFNICRIWEISGVGLV